MSQNRLGVWALAARPKTLPAAMSPVLIGSAMAWGSGNLEPVTTLACLLGALLIQIGTNLANDYFDHAKGADTPDRIGPTRATQSGMVSPEAMQRAIAFAFALACVPGLYIVHRGGWPFILIGLAAIACGILYTAGPYPLGYLGLGDLFVLVFFGPVAVGGTFFVQADYIDNEVLLAGLAAGLFSVAILTVNNLRDVDQDRVAGKRTLPVRFGRWFGKLEYAACILAGAVVIPAYLAVNTRHDWVFLAALTTLPALPIILTVFTRRDGPTLNRTLAATGVLLLVFSILFSIGWNL